MNVGHRGWIAYLGNYVVEVEFLGFDSHAPDYPGEPTKYWRLLEDVDGYEGRAGDIIDTSESASDETLLHEHRLEALKAALKYTEMWDQRERARDRGYAVKIASLRADIEALSS